MFQSLMPQQYLMQQMQPNGLQQLVALGQPPVLQAPPLAQPNMAGLPLPPQAPYGLNGWQDPSGAAAPSHAPPQPSVSQGGGRSKGGGRNGGEWSDRRHRRACASRGCYKMVHAADLNTSFGMVLVATHLVSPSLVLMSDFL